MFRKYVKICASMMQTCPPIPGKLVFFKTSSHMKHFILSLRYIQNHFRLYLLQYHDDFNINIGKHLLRLQYNDYFSLFYYSNFRKFFWRIIQYVLHLRIYINPFILPLTKALQHHPTCFFFSKLKFNLINWHFIFISISINTMYYFIILM